MQTFVDSYRYRFVLSNLVGKNFKALYRNMALGFFWSILNPLVVVAVFSIVWSVFFPSKEIPSFASFVIVAYIPYLLFQQCFTGCTYSILSNANLVKKVAFPRQILPFAVILTNTIHFLIQVPLVVAVLLIFPPLGDVLGLNLLWLPLVFLVQLGLIAGVGLLVAGLNVVYRDIQYVVESALVVFFWGSPIIYHAHDRLLAGPGHDGWGYLYYLNPMAGILEAYRSVLYFGQPPNWDTLGIAVIVTLAVGAWGIRSFWVHEKRFADLI